MIVASVPVSDFFEVMRMIPRVREDERDPRQWAVICYPAALVYAQRETREEAQRVLTEQRRIAGYFGTPHLVPPLVVDLPVGTPA